MRDHWSWLKKLIWLRRSGGGGEEPGTLSGIIGNLPLTFKALRNTLLALFRYGKCEQTGTPSPANPAAIKCNNGTLTFVSDGAPEGYVRLEYLEATGTQYISTGMLISPQTKYVIKYTPTTGTWIAGYTAGSNGRWGLAYNPTTEIMTFYSSKSNITVPMPVAYTEAIFDFGVGVTYNGETYRFDNTPATTGELFGWLFKAQGSSASSGSKVYYFAIYQGNEKVQELIPCRRKSDDVLGMYDTVTDTFFTNAGSGTFIAGPVVGQVEVVGTQEVVTLGGKNLFNKADEAQYINAFVHSNTNVITQGTTQWCFSIPCQPNTTYTLQGMSGTSRWGSFTSKEIGTVATYYCSGNGTITTGANDKWLVGLAYANSAGGNIDYRDDLQIEVGSTATDYDPYRAPHIASVIDLYGIPENGSRHGALEDSQNILTGEITRKCGVAVLDGTEEWTWDGSVHSLAIDNLIVRTGVRAVIMYCTHYPVISDGRTYANTPVDSMYVGSGGKISVKSSITNTADFKTFLTEQYAVGTPVIVVYPLQTATTEMVPEQHMSAAIGTNVWSTVSNIRYVKGAVTYYG